MIEKMPGTKKALPWQQVSQWLFAFDTACMAIFRTLALFSTHPGQNKKAMREVEQDKTGRQHLPYLRAFVLESLRLWPTTPLILRENTTETKWDSGIMPARTHIIIFDPYFHRDDRNLDFADHFSPGIWLKEQKEEDR